MEGDACYRFSTIREHIERVGAPTIRTAIDVGANVGAISLMMAEHFPEARIIACEAVEQLFQDLKRQTAQEPRISPRHWAVTAAHRVTDTYGQRPDHRRLCVYRGLPGGGPGWRGGSIVGPCGMPYDAEHYRPEALTAEVKTLDELVGLVLKQAGVSEIDLIKFDCEGCETSAIGCASEATLRKIRFVVGEYHCLKRFYPVVDRVLASTHHVNLRGDPSLGAFFAERKGPGPTILSPLRINAFRQEAD